MSTLRQALAIALSAALIGLFSLPGAAAETIYRCDHPDGSVIFSDSPCDAKAQPYRSGNTLSVIQAPNQLAERMAQNRAFIEQRRQELLQARNSGKAASPATDAPPANVQSQPWLRSPYGWPQPIRPGLPVNRQPDPADDRFSALSGPFPGTVRQRDRNDALPNDQ
jgi:hypothetical protein